MIKTLTFLLFLGIFAGGRIEAQETPEVELNEDYLKVSSIEVVRVKSEVLDQESQMQPDKSVMDFSPANVGQVIWIAQGLVGLGEGVYNLAQKGKPTNTTSYAPISVMPQVDRNYVEILSTENWYAPKKKTYVIRIKNLLGMEVVKFRYSVMFSYGGTYNETGAYITAAQIIPEYVRTAYGFDFSATMKLNGIQNHGSKENPVAGAILTMEYRIESVLNSLLKSDSFHITGRVGLSASRDSLHKFSHQAEARGISGESAGRLASRFVSHIFYRLLRRHMMKRW